MGRGGGKTVAFDTRQHHGSSDTQSQQSQQFLYNGSGGYSDRNTASPHSSQNSYRQPEVHHVQSLYLAQFSLYMCNGQQFQCRHLVNLRRPDCSPSTVCFMVGRNVPFLAKHRIHISKLVPITSTKCYLS